MNALAQSGLLQSLGWSLSITLVQAGLVALGLHVALAAIPLGAVRTRHRVALTAGAAVIALWIATALWLGAAWAVHARCWAPVEGSGTTLSICGPHGRAPDVGRTFPPGVLVRAADALDRGARVLAVPGGIAVSGAAVGAARTASGVMGLAAVLWLAGCAVLAIRTSAELLALRRIRRGSTPVSHLGATETLRLVSAHMRLTVPVSMAATERVLTPGIVGTLRPVVLVPPGLVESLDARELRALLAHELAHVCGGDYRVGLLQLGAERLLFFNPFARDVSRRITLEREACRDRTAVEVTGSKRRYAEMLLTLEHLRGLRRAPRGAVPLVGESALPGRIRRLAAAPRAGHGPQVWAALVVVGLLVLLAAEATLVSGTAGSAVVMEHDVRARSAQAP